MSMDAPSAVESQAKKPNTLLIVLAIVGIVGCCCVVAVAIGMIVLPPAMDATNLAIICTLMNAGVDSETCTAWAQDVRNNHAQEYQECKAQSSTEDSTNIYTCLDDRGLGLND